MIKNYFNILFCLIIVNCASMGEEKSNGANSIKVEKKSGWKESTKRVSTLSIYNYEKKKFGEKTDLMLNTYTASVDGKISEIYGEGIVGGDAITNLAKKLRLNNFEKNITNLVESQISGVPITEDTKKSFLTLTEKGKIDAIAIPVVTGGLDFLTKGSKIDLIVIIYNGKSSGVEILGKYEGVVAEESDLELFNSKPDQARANMNLTVINKTNELMLAMQKEIKPGKQKPETVAKSAEGQPKDPDAKTVEETAKDDKEPEALAGLDEWLKSNIKIGLGPLVMGFTAILFFVL